MLKTNDLVITNVKVAGKLQSIFTKIQKAYYHFAGNDPVKETDKTNNDELVKIDGVTWKGEKPENEFPLDLSDAAIDLLLTEALQDIGANYPESYKDADGNDVPVSPYITLLRFATNGRDLAQRGKIQAQVRKLYEEPKAVDPDKVNINMIRNLMSKYNITAEQAKKRWEKIQAMEFED